VATDYLHKNFDKLKEYATEPKDQEIEKKDKENATKLDVTKADKMMNTTAYKRMKAGDPKYADKTENVKENETDYRGSFDYELAGDDGEMAHGQIHYKAVNGKVDPNSLKGEYTYDGNHKIDDDTADEMIRPGGSEHEEALKAAQEDYDYEAGRMKSKFEGNQFAQAVQKAKAAGMKAGDKFKVGDQEYTLKDAIELAGLQLEEFFSEEDKSDKEGFEYPEGGKYGYKAERGSGTGAMGTMQVNVTIHNKETDETMYIKDMNYLELEKGDEQETLAMIWDENRDLIQKESVSEENPELSRIKNLAFYQ